MTTTTVSAPTTSTTLGCVEDRLTCICRAGIQPPECQGQPIPAAIRKKFAKACQAVARLTAGTPARQKKLHRTAESNLAKARALATKAGRKKISGDCARAIVGRLG